MTDKTTEALKLAEKTLEDIIRVYKFETGTPVTALAAIREALAEQSMVMILNDPHPPHRLCECTACLEYWTPLPDCDAFAGGGKPIDHIADTGKMIGCAYCDNPLFAGTKCNNCGRVTLAEPVKQEPVAWGCRFQDGSINDCICPEEHNRCEGDYNVPLYAAPVSAKAIRAEALEEAIKIVDNVLGRQNAVSAAIRSLKEKP